ncbi:MAG: PLP-dependent aminotransferase family protein, partial [Algicola sp.]|nr:PLP-dependent aminotransferase family protein [Algicola sp.]
MNFSKLTDPKLEVMNYLNEVAMDYPNAISFASGRPREAFFQLEDWPAQFAAFSSYLADEMGLAPS